MDRSLVQKPVAVTGEELSRYVILEVNDLARKAGISPGMTSTQALARCAPITLRAYP